MSYSKTYPILHHGFVDVPRHIKAQTGRMQTTLLRLYSHVMNVDIYRATRPSKALFLILCYFIMVYLLVVFVVVLVVFLFSIFSLLPFSEHRDTILIRRHSTRDL
jgi:cation transporter-like permease